MIAIAGWIVCVLVGIAGIIYGSTDGTSDDVLKGISYLIVGPFLSILYALLLYGFGELLETNQKMYGLLLRAVDDGTLKSPAQHGTWTCGACWNINPKNSAECAKCGAPRG